MAHVRVTADRKLQTGVHGKLCLSGGVHPTHAHACTCIPHMHRVVLVSIATRDVRATLWDVVGLDASPCSGCNGPPRIDAPHDTPLTTRGVTHGPVRSVRSLLLNPGINLNSKCRTCTHAHTHTRTHAHTHTHARANAQREIQHHTTLHKQQDSLLE